MIVDGVAIAEGIDDEVLLRVRALSRVLKLRVITCAPTFATKRFLTLKQARAEKLGVVMTVEECGPESTTDDIVSAVRRACNEADGVIVQLPLPSPIDTERVLAALPASHDVDTIGAEAERLFAHGASLVLPPVVGAIAEILSRHGGVVAGQNAVIVGEGRLVGAPAALWFTHHGASVKTLNRKTADISQCTQTADILVLGAGVPGLVTPDMVKDGVSIFDAGSSEETGKLVGDADPACAAKATLFTPVPGGIGPITVSLIFRNLLILTEHRRG